MFHYVMGFMWGFAEWSGSPSPPPPSPPIGTPPFFLVKTTQKKNIGGKGHTHGNHYL